MNEYDIYLKPRIHESKLFLCSIPYRDSVSVENQMLLKAILQYYTLQKMIAIDNDSELVSEIDAMLAIAYEMVDNDIEVRIDAELLSQCYSELSQDAIMAIQASASVGMKYYRLLEGLDGMTLEEMDGKTLGELGYVWLT